MLNYNLHLLWQRIFCGRLTALALASISVRLPRIENAHATLKNGASKTLCSIWKRINNRQLLAGKRWKNVYLFLWCAN